MSAQELRDLSPERQNAVLAATVFHLPHHLTDCVIDRFKKLMGILTRRADNQAAARVTRSGREVQKPLKDVFGSLPCGRDEGQRRGYTDAGLLHLISSNYPFVDDVGHFLRRGDCATERNIGILRHFERAVDAGKIGDLAGPGLGVESFGIARFAHLQRGVDIGFEKADVGGDFAGDAALVSEGEMNETMTINPASAISRATSATRRMFSTRAASVKPRSLLSPCRTLSPSRM